MAVEQNVLTEKLNTGTLASIGSLAAQESQRDKPRDYVSDRIMRRANKLVNAHLYELPLLLPAKKGETGEAYIKRLYAEALKRALEMP